MSSYFLHSELSAIKSTIDSTIAPKKTVIGTNFKVARQNLPMYIITLDVGTAEHHVRLNGDLHIIGIYEEIDKDDGSSTLMKTVLDAMEELIIQMREAYPNLGHNRFQYYINDNVFSVFGEINNFPLLSPFGGFRITYPNFRMDLQSNS